MKITGASPERGTTVEVTVTEPPRVGQAFSTRRRTVEGTVENHKLDNGYHMVLVATDEGKRWFDAGDLEVVGA